MASIQNYPEASNTLTQDSPGCFLLEILSVAEKPTTNQTP